MSNPKRNCHENNGRKWLRVSRANPCPVCDHPDWCLVAVDGSTAMCMRFENGCFRKGQNKAGEEYFLHRLLDGVPSPHEPAEERPIDAKVALTDSDIRHEVYSALLTSLRLTPSHREQLHSRGLTDESTDLRGYRSLPVQGRPAVVAKLVKDYTVEQLLTVPGFRLRDNMVVLGGAAGLLVPVRDLAGRIVALLVRGDGTKEELAAKDCPRYSYLSSAQHDGPGPGSPPHVPVGISAPVERVRLTEGALKADIAFSLSHLPTIGAPSVGSWKAAVPVLHQLHTKTVRIAFDADAAEKPHVARALADCYDGLIAEGFAVEVETWPAQCGKGIDDVLVRRRAKQRKILSSEAAAAHVAATLKQASGDTMNVEDAAEASAPNPLDRLDSVLTQGAEAFYRDKTLLHALAELAENDPAEFACVRTKLKNKKLGLRDLDAALTPLRQEIRAAKPKKTSAGEYRLVGGRIVHVCLDKNGEIERPLGNFSAHIIEQISRDDGLERMLYFTLEGALADGSPLARTEIKADSFAAMNWVVSSWGIKAVIYAGFSTKDHMRCAIQLLSDRVKHRQVYTHLGWRQINGEWLYLHCNGAIGAKGMITDVEVEPPDALNRYVLPAPPAGEQLCRAVQASLALLELAPARITFPLLAAVYRSVLAPSDCSLHLVGQTGIFKSELAALSQQHFGAGMDARHLPASWASTGNALEAIAFAAKDALLVVDDFAPHGNAGDVARLNREAERVLRAQGNSSGRQRMRPMALCGQRNRRAD